MIITEPGVRFYATLLRSIKFLREFNLRMGDFLCFAGTDFDDWEKVVFLAGD